MLNRILIVFTITICMMLNLFAVSVFADTDMDNVYNAVTVSKIVNKTNVFELKAKAAVLMDASTGKILLENNSNEKLPLASITKVMSMLLVMEAVDSGKISLDEKVQVSETAAGIGGSQAYIKAGEEFSVSEMLKAVAMHSSNDVTVALAEKVSGSEETFVAAMNEKAKELGMNNTNFLDCTGLTDEGHYSTAYDIALMSRELITKHPKILEYTTKWLDKFRNGTFDLNNTNKLVRFYQGADGLKTGFTRKAGFCLSATAKRNNLRLISVVLGEPDSNTRFAESRKLLDFGFANYEAVKIDEKGTELGTVQVKKGIYGGVQCVLGDDVSLLLGKGEKGKIEKEVKLDDNVSAPVKAGQKVGEVIYTMDGQEVGKADAVAGADVERASFIRLFCKMLIRWYTVGKY